MATLKSSIVSGRDHYDSIYQNELELEAQWLAYGSIDKADSIQLLLARAGIHPENWVELGCGTGAVIEECRRRRLAQQFTGVDFSRQALGHFAAHVPNVNVIHADILSPGFRLDEQYDLLVLTHVLEHLEDPTTLLRTIRSNVHFSHALFEVPLEDLLASRMKNWFRDRRRNPAGHVQFYTATSFTRLLAACGFEIVATRRYAPVMSVEMIEMLRLKNGESTVHSAGRLITAHYAPQFLQSIWAHLYYSNLAALCVKH